jgi:hypothetical protein
MLIAEIHLYASLWRSFAYVLVLTFSRKDETLC